MLTVAMKATILVFNQYKTSIFKYSKKLPAYFILIKSLENSCSLPDKSLVCTSILLKMCEFSTVEFKNYRVPLLCFIKRSNGGWFKVGSS